MEASEIAAALRRGLGVSDARFDRLLSNEARIAATRFWTPVSVARQAADWFESAGVERVLDVGSGVGKFCLVGALSSGLTFVGMEKRGRLVTEAETLAGRLGVKQRAMFVHTHISESVADGFDAFYAFNPFAENLYHLSTLFDHDPSATREHFARDVSVLEGLLARARVGFRLVTYHGCRARIPESFELSKQEYAGTNVLRMWTKALAADDGGFWRERFETTDLYSSLGQPMRQVRVPAQPGGDARNVRIDGREE